MKSRLPQGYGGGPQNMNSMIKQAQKMQEQIEAKQAEIEAREFTTTSGGGAVSVTMTGNKEIKSLKINPEVVDADDVEMLEDLITAAVNEVIRNIEEATSAEMGKISGGLSLPGLF